MRIRIRYQFCYSVEAEYVRPLEYHVFFLSGDADTIDGKRIFHPLKTTMTTWKKWSAWVSFTCAPYFLYSCESRPMYILSSIPPVFDLIDGINVEAIEEKIKRYSQENAEQIMINRARKVVPTIALLFLILVR